MTGTAPLANLRDHFQRVLDLAPHYSWTYDPPASAMLERQERLEESAATLRSWLSGGESHASWSAEAGGRFGSMAFARVPWIRVFAPSHAETILSGYFLLWLFALDGSRIYLSLTRGIYVQTDDGWKPCTDPELLRNWSAAARAMLKDADRGKFTQMGLDLASDDLPEDAASRQRVEAYELGNIYAVTYRSNELPSDLVLHQDLVHGLGLLLALYSDPPQ